MEELVWWRDNLKDINSCTMITSGETTVFEVSLAEEASGVGAYLGNIHSKSTILSFLFNEEEARGSSNFLELLVLDRWTLTLWPSSCSTGLSLWTGWQFI